MENTEKALTDKEVAQTTARRLVAAHLQSIESNPPTPDQTAMFEMFERERWPHEKRLDYIRRRAEAAAMIHAAE